MRTTAAWIVAIVIVCAAMIAFHVDISAARFFRSDTVVRDAFPGVSEPPYYDPAPYSLWLPSDWFVWDSLRSGHLPLWDRLQGGGYSPVICVQNGVFHPLRWLVVVAPREMAPSILIAIALMVTAWGTWLVLRDYGRSHRAAALAAVLFTFSSPLVMNFHFSGDLLPLAHTPWIVYFHRRRNFVALTLAIACLLLSGHPLYVVTVALVAIGFACAEAFDARSVRPAVMLVVASIIAIAVDAFAFVPPIASMGDLWFYKTETHQGSVYALFDPMEKWWHAIASMLIDRRTATSYFDDPEFWLYIGVPATILAAIGVVDAMQRTRDRVIAGVLLVMFMLSVPGPWMLELASTKPLTFMNRSYFAGGMTFALAVIVAGGFDFIRRQRDIGRVLAVVCGIAAPLMYTARAYEVLQPRRWSDVVRGGVIHLLHRDRTHRIIGTLGQTHLPNSSRITFIEDVRESTPVWLIRKHLWWQAIDPKIRRFTFPTFRMTDRLDSPLIGDFNVSVVVRSRLPVAGFHNGPGPVVTPAATVEPWRGLIRPRVHFAEDFAFVDSMEEVVRRIGMTTQEIVEWPKGVPPTVALPQSAVATVSYPSDNRAVIDANSRSGGLIVLHDTFDRGWRARLDGKPVLILPVNLISRGVIVGPGRHRVEMEYEPYRFRLGLAVSAAALIALLIARKSWRNNTFRAGVDSVPGLTKSNPHA